MIPCRVLFAALVWLLPTLAWAQGNGLLQIHFMNVGHGEAAVVISPLGEVVMIDNGVSGQCDEPVNYLRALAVSKVDYHIASDYDSDQIGCTPQILAQFPLQALAFDRGLGSGFQTYIDYVAAVGTKRRTAVIGESIVLDAATQTPVTLRFVAMNGSGTGGYGGHDRSLVVKLSFGSFDAVFGGDLSGTAIGSYVDVESAVAPLVGQIELYKVHNRGSQYSSNATWLGVTKPKVGIISVGTNQYDHPSAVVLSRLHAAGTNTYWTTQGFGAAPVRERDFVAGHIRVQVTPGSSDFVVSFNATQHHYPMWMDAPAAPTLVAPSGTIPSTPATLSWNAVAGATWYDVWLDDRTGTILKQWYPAAAAGCAAGTGTCAIASLPVAIGNAQWWVRAWNPGGTSPWSGMPFTLAPPPLVSAAAEVLPPGSQPILGRVTSLIGQAVNTGTVNLPSGARLWFYVDGPGWTGDHWVGSVSVAGLPPGVNGGPTLFAWAVPPTGSAGTYTSWARVFANGPVSPWSPGRSFTVIAPFTAAQVIGVSPVSGATPGGTAVLWARVHNTGTETLPPNAKVWFYVDGPGWTGDHWVGATAVDGLWAKGALWYAFTWPVPASAPTGTYTYWAQVWATGAISGWSSGTPFFVSP